VTTAKNQSKNGVSMLQKTACQYRIFCRIQGSAAREKTKKKTAKTIGGESHSERVGELEKNASTTRNAHAGRK
jgi:hypothetical protein